MLFILVKHPQLMFNRFIISIEELLITLTDISKINVLVLSCKFFVNFNTIFFGLNFSLSFAHLVAQSRLLLFLEQ